MSKIYNKIFAKVYDPVMHGFERSLFKKRKKLIAELSGTILDVGSGTGVNFKFYSPGTKIISVEPSPSMINIAKTKVSQKYQIDFHNCSVTDPGLSNHIPENSLDAVVSTLVMCTIPNPQQALDNFSKWLKPGGKLVVLEHIHASKPANRKFLSLLNPIWKTFSEGCSLTQDTDKMIKDAGFKALTEEYFVRTLRFHSGVFVKN